MRQINAIIVAQLSILRHNETLMPKKIPQAELDAIFQAAAQFPEGASVEDIRAALEIALPRRTLQRRLALLVEQGRLFMAGHGRGCRYRLSSGDAAVSAPTGKGKNKDEVLAILTRLKPRLARQFGVTRLALFGSTVRNEARADSDIDIVVAFDGPANSKRYFGVQFLLEDELGQAVDLVTEKALRDELRPFIEREVVNV